MEWVPTVFIIFKVVVLAIGMYLAVKWHYDKTKRLKGGDPRAALRGIAVIVVIFVVLVAGLLMLTMRFGRMLGLDLGTM